MNVNRVSQTIALLALLATAETSLGFYNPSTGRWLSRDPIGEKDTPNLMAFAKNCSVDFYDPDGRVTAKLKSFKQLNCGGYDIEWTFQLDNNALTSPGGYFVQKRIKAIYSHARGI